MKKELKNSDIGGMAILVLAAFFGMVFPMAARWILLSLVILGIGSYFDIWDK